jgi:hypothetical protein
MRADPRFKPLPFEPAMLLSEGRVDEAVQALRRSHRLGQREARRWIDAHIADNPMLRVQLETRQRATRLKFFLWFLLVDALLAAAIIYYLFYLR